jgi:hypothetical protein
MSGHACLDAGRSDKGKAGRLAQLVERLLYTQDVGGSSPSPPTSLRCGGSSGWRVGLIELWHQAERSCPLQPARRKRADG